MSARWSDHFRVIESHKAGNSSSKTTRTDVMLWEGTFEGKLLCVVSTVRLTGSNLAHFLVHSGARIGSHPWNLRGGHYVDLRVLSRDTLPRDFLRRLAALARTEEDRSILIRQGKETLHAAETLPASA